MFIARLPLAIIAASLVVVFSLTGLAQAQPAPGPEGSPEGAWRAQIHWIPMTDAAGGHHLLQARICRPPSDAPARVVIIANGTFPNNKKAVPGHCEAEAMRWFLDRGFIVISALRRGYGATDGDWAEGIAHKPGDDYFRPGLETARDIAATVDYATALSYAQSRAAVVIGHSGGGWGTIAYDSIPHPRVTALISMAGGRGQELTKDGLSGVWRPDLLVEAAAQFGRTATTPMLWVYSENDRFFSPAIAASIYDAFTRSGGQAELKQVAAYANDGHRFFFGPGGSQIWGPLVARYLMLPEMTVSLPQMTVAQSATANPDEQIVLWDAVIVGNLPIATAAIKAGADVNGMDVRAKAAGPNGRRPLNYAALRNDTAMITLLLDAGADINLVNQSGFTPLHHAAEAGSKEVAALLITKGADLALRTKDGRTAEQIAEITHHPDVVEVLHQAMKKSK
jgi:dienelactone hydrolase